MHDALNNNILHISMNYLFLKELERILKHMKYITDYFKPVVKHGQCDDFSTEECER